LDCGGLERIVLDLAALGTKCAQEVGVICLERPGTLANQAEALGARVFCAHKGPGIRPKTVARLRRFFGEAQPDIIHSHHIAALFYAGPAAVRFRNARIVHTEHGRYYDSRRRTRWLGRIAAQFASRFFCVSRDIADAVVAHRVAPHRKVVVIPNGIDTALLARRDRSTSIELRRSLGIPDSAPVIGTVGRLNEIKRHDMLLRAFAKVRSVVPDCRLVIVGDGPLMSDLRALAQALDVDRACHFAGYQTDMVRYYHTFDVFALTSRSEGMPLAVIEACAAGVAVVAARVGGVPEIIEDGRTGTLFEPSDEGSLTKALLDLIADPALARSMGEAGARGAQSRFDVKRMAEEYHHQYQELLHRE